MTFEMNKPRGGRHQFVCTTTNPTAVFSTELPQRRTHRRIGATPEHSFAPRKPGTPADTRHGREYLSEAMSLTTHHPKLGKEPHPLRPVLSAELSRATTSELSLGA
jgi:hypothetical protein